MSWNLLTRAAGHIAKDQIHHRSSDPNRSTTLRRVIVTIGIISTPVTVIVLVMVLGLAAIVGGSVAAAAGGALDIPPIVFSAYLAAESNAPDIAPDCQVDWPIIAGIWKVESGHATYGGRTISQRGDVTPPLFGVTLDGSTPDTAIITDTDNGQLDDDPVWDRAVGPAQFLPGSWRTFGQDRNRDGEADPQNVFDAALATVAHLCLATPGDYTNPTDLTTALLGYNHSDEYASTVTGWITYYRQFRFTQGTVTADGLYAPTLPTDAVTIDQLRRSHHDYPASDLGVPEGTPVYAAHPGTVTNLYEPCPTCKCGWGVTITGLDNHRYTYCHGTQTTVQAGVQVTAGELIMTSGNTGNSQTPHIHFQIRNPDGVLVCPQTLLEAWHQGIGLSPITAPATGCTH